MVTVFFIINIITRITIFSGKSKFPLSLNNADGEKFGIVLFSILLLLLAAAIHYLALIIPYGAWVYVLIAGIFYFIMMRGLRKKKWRDFM